MAVPVRVPNLVFTNTRAIKDPWHKAIGKLVLIAFYFLLRVGKYTYHNIQRRTQQFRLGDMKFLRKGTTNYHAALAMQTEGYQREDPATVKQMAVPVMVPNFVFTKSRETKDTQQKGSRQASFDGLLFVVACRRIYTPQ